MFTPEERDEVRSGLLRLAGEDPRLSGAAITGSASQGREDRWSDIDLFFGVTTGDDLEETVDARTALLHDRFGALHHFDLRAGSATYRAFILPSCLEVDLGFSPASEFGARGPGFRTVFGEEVDRPPAPPPDGGHVIGLSWHHTLHARVCIERDQPWQAEYWISGLRDHALTLACLRLGLPTAYAKGADAVPREVTAGLEAALVRSLAKDDLWRALRGAVAGFLRELHQADPLLGYRLEAPLLELAKIGAGQDG